MRQSPGSYRPEIDGMRAIAVIAVIIYHLKITLSGNTLLTGGFLGVDVFFVLSGFLITGLLVDEFHKTGRIRLNEFYWRRARRILPPLILVMLVSLPVAWAVLLPSELERYTLSLAAALAFVSNFFWFLELSDYGAQSGLLQPFLHTWSLAIEEQFYLIFPLLMIVLMRYLTLRHVMAAIAGLAALGFLLAAVTTALHPAFSFYTPTSRAWELLAGALLAVASRYGAGRLNGCGFLYVPGLSLLVLGWAFVTQDLLAMRHPGVGTLPVIAATCGLIWCADPREPVTRILSTGPMVWIGKVSYSLYLWHFPIFAFGRILSVGTPSPFEMAIWVVLTVALSALGYTLIERPFRFRLKPRAFAIATVAALAPIGLVMSLTLSGGGAQSGRTQALTVLYGENEIDNSVLRDATWDPLNERFPEEDIGTWNALRPSVSGVTKLWFKGADTRKVLLIGDSLSKDVYNALTLNADRFLDHEFARFNVNLKSLENDLETLRGTPNFAAADVVVIAPNHYRAYRHALGQMLEAVGGQGKEIIVLGNTAKFNPAGAHPLFDWYLIKSGDPALLQDLNALAPKYEDARSQVYNAEIRHIAEMAGATYLSRRALVCPDHATCTLVTDDGFKTMYDDLHWTLEGAALFGARAADAGWLSSPDVTRVGE
ncbi:MAG: acyltransferase family protein [Pseudomonadota bacterium]